MEIKKLDLNLDISKPFSFEITNSDVFVTTNNNASINIEYSPFGNIHPEIIFVSDAENRLNIKNSEIIKSKIILNLPENLKEINIHAVNGTITTSGLNGNIKLQIDIGDINVERCQGKMSGVSFKGDIKIKDYDGFLDLNSNIGSIKIINWDNASGTISSSDKIVLGLKNINNNITARSNNADVCIGLSKESSCNIIARAVDVINYLEDPLKGKNLGNIASINYSGGKNKIEAMSSAKKVIIAKIENLKDVSPDMEDILKEMESSFKESFKSFSDIMGKIGKNFSKNIMNLFSESKDNKENNDLKNEKIIILNMLKEGKITSEEAEKLLKALK